MRLKFVHGLLLVFLFLLANCTNTSPPVNPVPGQVRVVPQSAVDSPVERGIDAASETGKHAIFLQWYSVKDNDLIAYDIYRSANDSSGNFPRLASVEKSFGAIDTVFYDESAQNFIRYFYYIRARDEKGQEGPRSIKINYQLVPQPDLTFPVNTTVSGEFTFQWTFSADFFPDDFVFRLERELSGNNFINYFAKLFSVGSDYTPNQEWTLSRLGLQVPLPSGKYRWRIDVVGVENNQGAESQWQTFFVQQ